MSMIISIDIVHIIQIGISCSKSATEFRTPVAEADLGTGRSCCNAVQFKLESSDQSSFATSIGITLKADAWYHNLQPAEPEDVTEDAANETIDSSTESEEGEEIEIEVTGDDSIKTETQIKQLGWSGNVP